MGRPSAVLLGSELSTTLGLQTFRAYLSIDEAMFRSVRLFVRTRC